MLSKRKPKPSTKNLSAALQAVNNPLKNVVGIHEQQKTSKPNLPSVLKPSKLLLQWGYAEPIFSLAYRISLLDHSINQYEIGPFLTASQTPNDILTNMGTVRKGFGNIFLKVLTMERKKVEEFEESLCEDCGWINLVFLQDFSLKILSGSSLNIVGIRVYI